jgi:hypothetical protein
MDAGINARADQRVNQPTASDCDVAAADWRADQHAH